MELRADVEVLKAINRDPRSDERLRAHYALELQLANRLLKASRSDRAQVYGEVYSELFASLPDHPQNTKRQDGQDKLDLEFARIRPFLSPTAVFLEIGCGDAALALRAAPHVAESIGLDVTGALVPKQQPRNFTFLLSDGVNIRLGAQTVALAYSNQLLEHLHPQDAADQLREVVRVLAPGGRYYCSTPSRASGPHDISCYFDYQARGFHLKEYDYGSLRRVFLEAGFRKVDALVVHGAKSYRVPYAILRALEIVVLALPKTLRARVSRNGHLSQILGVTVLAQR